MAELYRPDADGAMSCVCDHFQAPAAAMCRRCPHLAKATQRDLECWRAVMELRSEEAHTVEILPDNVDHNGQKNCAIECFGAWTNWTYKRFAANTLHEALRLATEEKGKWGFRG